jgi:hypothetical protein
LLQTQARTDSDGSETGQFLVELANEGIEVHRNTDNCLEVRADVLGKRNAKPGDSVCRRKPLARRNIESSTEALHYAFDFEALNKESMVSCDWEMHPALKG